MTAQQRTDAQIVALIKPDGQQFSIAHQKGDIIIYDVWVNGVANDQVGLAFAKIEIYGVMKAMYTQWHGSLTEIDVVIQGPDRIGNLAAAYLFADTAAHFDWPHLVPATAWQQYDYAESSL